MSNSFMVGGGAGDRHGRGSCTADSLLAASGVHHLLSNHVQILSETVYRSFEVPLLHELDAWQRHLEEEEEAYQKSAKALSKEIRRLEKEGLRLHRQRKRDVGSLREHLVLLTTKLDGLTTLHGGHSRGLLGDCQDLSRGVVECGAGLVRAEVDIFEALARKGWAGGGLDDLLEKGRDLFANESDTNVDSHHGAGGNGGSSKIFSILPQNRSILAADGQDTGSAEGRAQAHRRNDSLLTDGLTYQSLTGAVTRDSDMLSIFSEGGGGTTGILNRSRGVRPFSPPPMERVKVSDPLEGIVPFGGAVVKEGEEEEEPGRGRSKEREADGIEGVTDHTTKAGEADHDGKGAPEYKGDDADAGLEEDEEKNDKKDTTYAGVVSAGTDGQKAKQRRWSVTDEGSTTSD